jgi:hypothetical protein
MVTSVQMIGPLALRNVFWLGTTATEIILLVYLLRRKLQSTHLAFVIYIAATILQSALAACIYIEWGGRSKIASTVIWGSQGILICLRFSAVFEMASRTLSAYHGLWTLAKRLMSAMALATLAYSLLIAKKQIYLLVINLDRGLELAIAVFVVALLLFARYYLLPVHPLDRALAIGFCMYSCFYVVNDSLFEKYLDSYLGLWGYLDVLTFLASLLIWIKAVRAYSRAASTVSEQQRIPTGVYGTISPELNFRLKHLNEQLAQLLHAGNQRS